MQTLTKNEFFFKKELLLTGALASIIYILTFIFVGVIGNIGLISSASGSVDQTIGTELGILVLALIVYYLLMILFGLVLFVRFSEKNLLKMKISGLLIIFLGVLGLLIIIFPSNLTFDISINSFLAILQWFTTLAVIIATGLGSVEIVENSSLLIISIVVLAIVVLTLAIGLFLIWIALISYMFYLRVESTAN